MLVITPDCQFYGSVPGGLDPGPEWPGVLVDHRTPTAYGEVCCKWSKEVRVPEELWGELRRAYVFAQSVPRGPVLLQVPFEILHGPVWTNPDILTEGRIHPTPTV